MKHFTFAVAMLFSFQTLANPADPDPKEEFDFTKRITDSTQVTVKVVENVKEACFKEAEMHKIKPNYKNPIACSFWAKNWCTIIVAKSTTIENIGHEVRHCFQGNWHP
jgi:hypothetical protein